jgi:hypothetical protein
METQTTESEGKRDVEKIPMIKEEVKKAKLVKKNRWKRFRLKKVMLRGLKKLGLRSM